MMTSAFVLVNCHFPFNTRIMDEIRTMRQVSIIHRTEGRYDLIVKVDAETAEKLGEIISNSISKISGVDDIVCLTVADKIV